MTKSDMSIHIKGVGPEWLREQFDDQFKNILEDKGRRPQVTYDWDPKESAAIPPGWLKVQEILAGAIVEKPVEPSKPRCPPCTTETRLREKISVEDVFEKERRTHVDFSRNTVTINEKETHTVKVEQSREVVRRRDGC